MEYVEEKIKRDSFPFSPPALRLRQNHEVAYRKQGSP